MRMKGPILIAGIAAAAVALSACGGNKTATPSASPAATKPAASPGTGTAASPGAAASPGTAATPGTASPPGAAASPAAGGTAGTVNAEALFKQTCVACHGADMTGNGAANRNLTKVGARHTQEQIAGIITNGQNGMPSFKGQLKDAEINALAAWLATKK